jgi:hypothetical protein
MNTHTRPENYGAPSVLTIIVPLLAAIIAYIVFAEMSDSGTNAIDWWQQLFDAAPALLVGILFEVFVLLPLRALFVRTRIGDALMFFGVSALAWLVMGGAVLSATTSLPRLDLWASASVMVPGLVLAGVFTLMCRTALRR